MTAAKDELAGGVVIHGLPVMSWVKWSIDYSSVVVRSGVIIWSLWVVDFWFDVFNFFSSDPIDRIQVQIHIIDVLKNENKQ